MTYMNDMKNKDKTFLIRSASLTAIIILGIIGMIIYNSYSGNMPQVFTDVIDEATSGQGSNKTAERNLYYIFSIAGSLLYCLVFYLAGKKRGDADREESENTGWKLPVISLFTIALTGQLFYSKVDTAILLACLFSLILLLTDRALITDGLAFMFAAIYSVCAVYRIYVFVGGKSDFGETHILLIAFALSLILLSFSLKKTDIYARGLMILQLIIPFVLLIFTASEYYYFGADLSFPVPIRIRLIIFAFIGAMVLEAALIIKHNFSKESVRLKDIISYGSCISILSFSSYFGQGAILSSDYHHPYENIIGFSQIFELGQKAFTKYTPVSGAYSIITGAVFSILGRGKMTYYNVTQNLFFLGIAAITVIILGKVLANKEWLLFVAVLFKISDYNRIALILPIILILSSPVLIEKKNAWLKTWFLTSLIHGLFYPLFGAAVCAGFLPLAVYQAVTLVHSEEFKEKRKQVSFYVGWLICLIPAFISIPWLLGTYRHISALGGQTIYADGLTRFSQFPPEGFLPYVGSLSVKMVIYYTISYSFPVSIIWICTALALHMEDMRDKLLVISGGIVMLVSFSYTVIRMDPGSPYARSEGVILAIFVFLIIIADRHIKNVRIKGLILIYALILTGVCTGSYESIGTDSKLESKYTVPDGYTRTDGYGSRFGDCFILNDEAVTEKLWLISQLDKKESYFALGDFGYYYLYDLKGDGPMEAVTVKGYDAAMETIDILRKNHTLIGTDMSSLGNYYLYHWLVTSGKYVWDDGKLLFTPNDTDLALDKVHEINRDNPIPQEAPLLTKTASSWGSSMSTLEPLFDEKSPEYDTVNEGNTVKIAFNNKEDGNDFDFIYLDIENDLNFDYKLFEMGHAITQNVEDNPFYRYVMRRDYNPGKNVIISWTDDQGTPHSMTCSLGRGKLLVPLGGGKGWLLNGHDNINISVADDEGKPLDLGGINSIRFLKLREIPR